MISISKSFVQEVKTDMSTTATQQAKQQIYRDRNEKDKRTFKKEVKSKFRLEIDVLEDVLKKKNKPQVHSALKIILN